MSDKTNLQKKIEHLNHRISQLQQFGYEDESLIKQEDLVKLKLELADIELKELLPVEEPTPPPEDPIDEVEDEEEEPEEEEEFDFLE